MKNLLSRLRNAPSKAVSADQPDVSLAPDHTLYVIGDVHGCSVVFEELLGLIDADIGARGSVDPILVLVGDYVDRGEDSAYLLSRLYSLSRDLPDNVICLMGNHEKMLLDFLDDPAGKGPRWLRNGGLQTLASFGLRGLSETPTPEALWELANAFRAAMPSGQEAWLRQLPLMWASGNICVVHAAADPKQPIDAQDVKVLLWGSGRFLNTARTDGVCVVHGHTVVEKPERHATRIAVDTGAYYTGVLTAACLRPTGDLTFLQTGK